MREKLIELVHNARMNALWHNAKEPSEYITDMLITSGVVPVVRCKDCKHFVPFVEPYNKAGMCNRKMLGLIPEDGFCSYGERKDHD